MTATSSDDLLTQARVLSGKTGDSLFRALNLVQLLYLEELIEYMTDRQRSALLVACDYWRDGTRSPDELDAAGTDIWGEMKRVSPDWSIIGLEVHLTRALIGVMAPEYQTDMGEVGYCLECADWFPKMMWNWCDLTVDECLCLSRCLDIAVRAGQFQTPVSHHASKASSVIKRSAEPGAVIDVHNFMVSVPISSEPERLVEFGDLSMIGTAVHYVATKFDNRTAINQTKSNPDAWHRLKGLFNSLLPSESDAGSDA